MNRIGTGRDRYTDRLVTESFQYRVKLRADSVLEEEDYIDALLLAPALEYIKKWIPEDWPLAFFDHCVE